MYANKQSPNDFILGYRAMEAAAPAAGPQSVLESAINSVSGGIDDAFGALGLLANRLQIVLQPEVPTPVGNVNCATDCAPRSEAVARLHSLRVQLEALTARINGLNGRLDS